MSTYVRGGSIGSISYFAALVMLNEARQLTARLTRALSTAEIDSLPSIHIMRLALARERAIKRQSRRAVLLTLIAPNRTHLTKVGKRRR